MWSNPAVKQDWPSAASVCCSGLPASPYLWGSLRPAPYLHRWASSMRAPSLCFALVMAVAGCASSRDFVMITPVRFVPVVGAGGPSCQGLCPTTKDEAERFRVEVGNPTFRRITADAKAQGKDGDAAFLEFARREVEVRGYCAHAVLAPWNPKQPIGSVEGWSVFSTLVSCAPK